ncbi:BgTH12-01219 [Blumeria graminis f. sp. triticale]|uniref:Bgt-50070 n=2 Tax=Blumeria graminis TaxID=34373 RepID=A0A9X9MNL6_BLUGR|nr:BgTH12-01219 [Blumeria graminis f. sp. triticale]VDB93901.1 Bgt-50070 [Blumeria graminis f. sp. tritici]
MSSMPVSLYVVIYSLTVHFLMTRASINVSDTAEPATLIVQKMSP